MSARTFAGSLALLALSAACGATELDVPDASSPPDASSGPAAPADASAPPDATLVNSATATDSSALDSAPDPDSATPVDAGPCGPAEHLCSGTCYPNDIQHCGPSCVACGAPANGYATCDGTQCGYGCNVLACGTTCVDPTTDRHNCGACGHDCGEATCQESLCQPIAITSMLTTFVVHDLAVDANNVYWTLGQGGGSVFQTALAGGTTITLTSTSNDPGFVVVDATSVYYEDCVGSVDRIPIGGGPTTRLDTENLCVGQLVLDGETLFFGSSRGLEEMSADGGSPATVLDQWVPFAVDANNFYWAVFDGSAYSTIYELPRGADAAAALPIATSVPGNVYSLASDATNVYVSDGGHVWSVPIGGGAMTTISPSSGGSGLVADGTGVYWADAPNNAVRAVTPGGGGVSVLAQPAGSTSIGPYVALDATYVYFFADLQGTWTLYKVPK